MKFSILFPITFAIIIIISQKANNKYSAINMWN